MHQVDELKTADRGDSLKNGGHANAQRVEFAPEQQAKVQELINEAFTRAYSKASKEAVSPDEVGRLKSEVQALKKERKTTELFKVITKFNVVNAEDVAKLLEGSVRLTDDGKVVVVNESGAPRITHAGYPMGIDEYVAGWLRERPHFLRPSGVAGAGSHGVKFGPETFGGARHDISDPAIWRRISRDDLDNLLKEGIVVRGSAGQVYNFRDVKNPFVEARRRKAGASKGSKN